jgi:hypothetical protein
MTGHLQAGIGIRVAHRASPRARGSPWPVPWTAVRAPQVRTFPVPEARTGHVPSAWPRSMIRSRRVLIACRAFTASPRMSGGRRALLADVRGTHTEDDWPGEFVGHRSDRPGGLHACGVAIGDNDGDRRTSGPGAPAPGTPAGGRLGPDQGTGQGLPPARRGARTATLKLSPARRRTPAGAASQGARPKNQKEPPCLTTSAPPISSTPATTRAYSGTQADSRAREHRRDRPVPTAAPGFWLVRQHGADDREGRPRRHDMANQAHNDVGAAAADRRPWSVR